MRLEVERIEAAKHHTACFELGTNIETDQLSDAEVIAGYKEHSVGLRHFDTRYFGVRKRSARSPHPPGQVAFASSPRLQMTALGDACAHLLESESLQRM